jgi:hypothetical protein
MRATPQLFDGLVAAYRCTCGTCPTQYDGTLRDGRTFYFRYRGGYASLGIGATLTDAVIDRYEVEIRHGDDLDGFMDQDEFKSMFVRLAEIHGSGPVFVPAMRRPWWRRLLWWRP